MAPRRGKPDKRGDGTSPARPEPPPTSADLAEQARDQTANDRSLGNKWTSTAGHRNAPCYIFVSSKNLRLAKSVTKDEPISWVKESGANPAKPGRTYVGMIETDGLASKQLLIQQVREHADLIVPHDRVITDDKIPGIIDCWPNRYKEGAEWKYCTPQGSKNPWSANSKASEIFQLIQETTRIVHERAAAPVDNEPGTASASAARAAVAALVPFVPPPSAIRRIAASDRFGHSVLRMQIDPEHYCATLELIRRLALQHSPVTPIPTGTLRLTIAPDPANERRSATGAAVLMELARQKELIKEAYTNAVWMPVRQPKGEEVPERTVVFDVLVNGPVTNAEGRTETTEAGITVTLCVRDAAGRATRKEAAEAVRTADTEAGELPADATAVDQLCAPALPPLDPQLVTEMKAAVKRFRNLNVDAAALKAVTNIITKVGRRKDLSQRQIEDAARKIRGLRNPSDLLPYASSLGDDDEDVAFLRTNAGELAPALDIRQPKKTRFAAHTKDNTGKPKPTRPKRRVIRVIPHSDAAAAVASGTDRLLQLVKQAQLEDGPRKRTFARGRLERGRAKK